MKSIRSLFIFLIGMISLTTYATTLEQKQKAVVSVEFSHPVTAVVVQDYNTLEAFSCSNLVTAINANEKEVKRPVVNSYVIIDDVGWQNYCLNNSDKIINTRFRKYVNNNTDSCFKENVLSRREIYNLNKYSLKSIPKQKSSLYENSIPFRNYYS